MIVWVTSRSSERVTNSDKAAVTSSIFLVLYAASSPADILNIDCWTAIISVVKSSNNILFRISSNSLFAFQLCCGGCMYLTQFGSQVLYSRLYGSKFFIGCMTDYKAAAKQFQTRYFRLLFVNCIYKISQQILDLIEVDHASQVYLRLHHKWKS